MTHVERIADVPRLMWPFQARAAACRAFTGSVMALLALGACRAEANQSVSRDAERTGTLPNMSQSYNLPRDDGQWTRPARDYASTRFSALDEIDTTTVTRLHAVVQFPTNNAKGHEGAPVVVNNTMYLITPFPNVVYALDLTKRGAPVKWSYHPNPLPASQGVACCDVVNRGVVYDSGRIVFNTLDARTIALDAKTGAELWVTKVGEINIGESVTMAPLVVKGRVLVGNSGGEFGVRGWLKALDVTTGKLLWTAWSTGPDSAVLIGKSFKPHYAGDSATNQGVTTWPADAWRIGGGTVWGWISYDESLDLIYYGTGNPGPWNSEVRPGDNKWTATIFARRPETGEAVWAYQMSAHDMHDYDGVNEMVLADVEFNGQSRKIIMHPDRNGYVYLLDRATGEVLSAQPFGHITSSLGIDSASGKLRYNLERSPRLGHVTHDICPAPPGTKDWQPSAYSPITGMLYIPHQNLCADVEGLEANYIAGTPYVGTNVKMHAGPGGNRGLFDAWNPQTGKVVWSISEDFPVWSGALVTAGNVVFYGTMDGWFKAVNAISGKALWQFKTSSGVIGQPVTYRGPDGHQYVAVFAGVGGWSGAIVAAGFDPRDSSGALGFVNAMKDLPGKTGAGGMLYIFAL